MSKAYDERRARIIIISTCFLNEFLRGCCTPIMKTTAPSDLEIVAIEQDAQCRFRQEMKFIVCSASFEPVPEGQVIPAFIPEYTTDYELCEMINKYIKEYNDKQ